MEERQYELMKEKDLSLAKERVRAIKDCKDPLVKYRNSRPIMDLKHMIESSSELFADHTAFFVKDRKGGPYRPILYREMMREVNALGTALIGIGLKGKRIAVMGDNSYQWAISYLAVVCGTGVVVPMDKELGRSELETILRIAEVEGILCDEKYIQLFCDIRSSGNTKLKKIVSFGLPAQEKESREDSDGNDGEGTDSVGPAEGAAPESREKNNGEDDSHDERIREETKPEEDGEEKVIALQKLIAEGEDLLRKGDERFTKAQIIRDEMSVLLFTSGTTGNAKGVMLSHGNLVEDLMSAPTVLQVTDKEVFFSFLPLHHTYECTCGFLMPLYKGSAIAYCEGLKYIQKNLAEARPTFLLGVPVLLENLYHKIWKNVRKRGKEKTLKRAIQIQRKTKKVGIDLSGVLFQEIKSLFGGRMRMIICGGAAINPEVLDGLQDFGIMALQGYGLTEAAPMGALNPDTRPKSASIGRPLPGFSLKIHEPDEEGIGEICLKGGNIMLGYYQMPEETEEVLRDGWFHTGDLGYQDDEGYVYITGRKKNVIITKNGKNVFPEELEYLLGLVPLIAESMVWSKETEAGDDTIIVATIRPDFEAFEEQFGESCTDELIAEELWKEVNHINEDLPFYKKIKNVILRREEFDKTTSKKIRRFVEGNRESS